MIERLISFAVLLQMIENLFLTPWPWAALESEMPAFLRPILKFPQAVPAACIPAALVTILWPNPYSLLLQILCVWLYATRFRGTVNGGSDFMTFQILAASLLASLKPEWNFACLFYITGQLALSYFVAGLAKIRRPGWRTGETLAQLFKNDRGPLRLRSWAAMAFELLFPVCILNPKLCLLFLFAGSVFHLLNFYYFGLNRFFFVWLSGYPAVLFTSLYLSQI